MATLTRKSPAGAHKPFAHYSHVVTAQGEHPDLVWYYPEPLPAVEAIRDHLAFYDERVTLRVDE